MSNRFKVYRNIRRHCYSLMSVATGKVVRHESVVVMENVKFIVRPAGRDKVRATKRKNVHAFVDGELAGIHIPDLANLVRVSYNPYENDTFVLPDNTPVKSAKFVILNSKDCWITQEEAGDIIADSIIEEILAESAT